MNSNVGIIVLLALSLILVGCDLQGESRQSGSSHQEDDEAETAKAVGEEIDDEEETSRADEPWWKREKIGELHLGLSDTEVVQVLGEPYEATPPVYQGADGTYVTTWSYPDQGLSLSLSQQEEGGDRRLSYLNCQSPCELQTQRGIGLGSTEEEALEAYREEYDESESVPESLLVMGSIYGGIAFGLEDGEVNRIFIGASAE